MVHEGEVGLAEDHCISDLHPKWEEEIVLRDKSLSRSSDWLRKGIISRLMIKYPSFQVFTRWQVALKLDSKFDRALKFTSLFYELRYYTASVKW
jgi:hypothetical protein